MKSYIAALEILNFDYLAQNNTPDEFQSVCQRFNSLVTQTFDEHKASTEENREFKLAVMITDKQVIVRTKDCTPVAFGQVVAFTQCLLAVCLVEGFPLRGCIDSGTIDKKTASVATETISYNYELPTRGLISKAFDHGQLMLWSGCILSARTQQQFEKSRTKKTCNIEDFVKHNGLFWFYIPEIEDRALVVNWLAGVNANISVGMLEMVFAKHNKGIPDEETANLVLVTHSFVNQVQAPLLN